MTTTERPPTDRAYLRWHDQRVAALRAEQGVDSPILACADCGRRDTYHYVQPQHPFYADGREDVARCGACLGAINARLRAERKAALAARPKDCRRCGARPHRWVWAGYRLCGRCKTATEAEHARALAKVGNFAIFSTGPMVDTSTWADANGTISLDTVRGAR